MKRNLLLVNAVLMTLYLVGGTYYYYTEGAAQAEAHPIFAAVYFAFVNVHAGLLLLAVLCQAAGYFFHKPGAIVAATIFVVVAALELVLLLVPLAAGLVFLVLNLVAGAKAANLPVA